LLRFLLGLDLIDRVMFWMLPVDDPLPWLLLDQRAAKVTATHDETWLRVVDVEKALAARQYADGGEVTIAVDDAMLPGNSITMSVTADGAERVDRHPQVRVGVAGLGAVLLGGATWHNLSIAGLARVDDPAHVAAADRLFAVPQAPHAGFFF
jgi:predicted acetyltransferase